jgi:Arc/MetJ-type ribon-helix-helix transcriptional regulator
VPDRSAISATDRVLRDGLRLLAQRNAEDEARLAMLRGALEESDAAIEAADWEEWSPTLLEEIDREERSRPRQTER